MKSTLIIRICLICLILAATAFLIIKLNFLWKGKTGSKLKGLANVKNSYNLRRNLYKTDKKIEKANNDFSKTNPPVSPFAKERFKGDYEAVPVEITRVKRSDIEIFLVNNCTLEPEKQVDIAAKISGIVKNILVEEGHYVESGKSLAELDDEESILAFKEAKVKKDIAERVYKRSFENFKNNIISEEEFEDKKFQFEIASVELERKQLEHSYTTITSPIDGVVVNRDIEEGHNVQKDQVVFKIADFEPILAKIYIPEKDLNKVEDGQTARIISEFLPEIELTGKVKMVSPIVDPASGTVKVTIEIADLTGGVLKPGMFVSVYTVIGQHQNALVIPKKALILEAEADEVFVVKYFFTVNINSIEIEGLDIGNSVLCKQKRYEEDGITENNADAIRGKVVDISRNHDDKTVSVMIEADNVIDIRMNRVFDTVSFYDDQEALILQIKDTAFDIETKAFKTRVALGFKKGNIVEVLTGLKEGDAVITVGQNDVGHGADVVIVKEDIAAHYKNTYLKINPYRTIEQASFSQDTKH